MTTDIYTTGFPRSGTWWCTRLLSDLLDSPIKTLPPDNVTVSDFCPTCDGGYVIYKTHWRAAQYHNQGKIVFIQRDPRDVAVSAFYYRRSLEKTPENLLGVIHTMVNKKGMPKFQVYHKMGVYQSWIQEWLDRPDAIKTKYELLHTDPINELGRIFHALTGEVATDDYIQAAYDRQRFENHKHKYPHAMRKGISGDWQNHFNREHGRLITEHIGDLMLEQGYIDSPYWWMELKE